MSTELKPIKPNTIEECCQVCEAIRCKRPVRVTYLDRVGSYNVEHGGLRPDFDHFRFDLLEEVEVQAELPELCYIDSPKHSGIMWHFPGDVYLVVFEPGTLCGTRYAASHFLSGDNLRWRKSVNDPWQPVFRKEYKVKPFNK